MTQQIITPYTKPITGVVTIPGSKSITNRALLLAALAEGESHLSGMLASDDSETAAMALQVLGVSYEWNRQQSICDVKGCNGKFPKQEGAIFFRDSGTATRFIIPACAAMQGQYQFSASPRMSERPLAELLSTLSAQGSKFSFDSQAGQMPFTMVANGLIGGEAWVDIKLTSQFLSGLLMASPLARKQMIIQAGDSREKPYINMTIEMMKSFGIEVVRSGDALIVNPGQYKAQNYVIEPDASTASYFFAMAALTQGEITINGLKRKALQGDTQFLNTLEQMGAQVIESDQGITVKGPQQLHGLDTCYMRHFSDTFMTVAALAVFADSPTTLTGLAHTRLQDSDRIAAMETGLAQLGIHTESTEDSLKIHPGKPKMAEVHSHNDHRIAMSLSLVGLVGDGIIINDAQVVSDSCPDYFQMLNNLVSMES